MPEESVFMEDKDKTTASLVLDVLGGASLSQSNVNGIVHLVASSVKGLNTKGITVVDTNGNVLYAYEDEGMIDSGLSMKQLDVQRQYEKTMQNRISTMLSQVFGNNSSVVRVNVRMNFDKSESESEIFLPSEERIIRSARAMEEGFEGKNAANPANIATNLDDSNYSKIDETTNYEVSKKNRTFTQERQDI